MRFARSLLAASLAAALATPAMAEVPIDVIGDTEIYFDALLHFDAYQYDNNLRSADGLALTPAQVTANTLTNNGQVRRGEMIFRGRMANGGEWQVGYDFVGSRGTGRNGRWLDVNYRGRINSDWTWRVGQFKQPNSLEELTSTRNNEFISKAMITNAFGVARRVGAEVQYATPSITATGTYFTREINVNQRVGTGWGARATWAPIMDAAAGEYLHFGLSGVRIDALGNRYGLSSRPQADITAVNTVTASLTDADDTTIYGLEGLYANGPVKIMGEYMTSTTRRNGTAPDFKSDGWYLAGLYTLGDDKFGYRGGIYTTAVPTDPVKGMWQLGARYDKLDANDGAVLGGQQESWTLGVNWYIRSNFRLSVNYVMLDSSRVQSSVKIENNPNILELRGQIAI
ncbi:MAG: OprO/OprP family phosphate-selective porin [Lysobacteraceae bacterium]